MPELADLTYDITAEAKSGFESTQRMRVHADARTAQLVEEETELVSWMDEITEEWKAKALRLEAVRREKEVSQALGDSLSDAMDRLDDVLRLQGVEREPSP